MKPVIEIHKPDAWEPALYNVVAPCGYHLGYQGEHSAFADTLEEAQAMKAYRCSCEGCVDWRRDAERAL